MAEIPNNPPPNDRDEQDKDWFLPLGNVTRIMKKISDEKISKEAKEAMQKCVSEFISLITSEASYKCKKENRKTLNGDDLLWSISECGFEDYIAPLRIYLDNYRKFEAANKARMEADGGHMHSSDQFTQQGSITPAINYLATQGEGPSARMGSGGPVGGEGSSRMQSSAQLTHQGAIFPQSLDDIAAQLLSDDDEEPINQEQFNKMKADLEDALKK